MITNQCLLNEQKYICEYCDYITGHKSHYNKHLATSKHKNSEKGLQKSAESADHEGQHKCHCNKVFSHRQNLYRHKKTCKLNNTMNMNGSTTSISSDLILEVIKQSKEIQNVLIEQNKELQAKLLEMAKSQTVVNNNTMNNNNFNLQVFLNETCKDAINIMDFVNSLQLKVEDFVATGKLGYVEGISRIIINGMKNIEIEKRPMHCTDVKRETVYIKDEDRWLKEDVDRNKLKKVIKTVAQLNLNQLPKWQEQNPDYVKINTPENENLIKYSLSALGSRTDEEEAKFLSKIMKNVLKEVAISRK